LPNLAIIPYYPPAFVNLEKGLAGGFFIVGGRLISP
jgi:hypothetical protein